MRRYLGLDDDLGELKIINGNRLRWPFDLAFGLHVKKLAEM